MNMEQKSIPVDIKKEQQVTFTENGAIVTETGRTIVTFLDEEPIIENADGDLENEQRVVMELLNNLRNQVLNTDIENLSKISFNESLQHLEMVKSHVDISAAYPSLVSLITAILVNDGVLEARDNFIKQSTEVINTIHEELRKPKN